ncbi:hypothetical protein [Amycolatopsis sp. NPDC059657]|uniref:hypothetical protein n=1 Tax=Amycolatopsis sp. NPDC059657 TaxID=3346899 RepID=UPI00366C2DD8
MKQEDIDSLIAHAVEIGWQLVPLNDRGEKSLVRSTGSMTDVVTLSDGGHNAVVVRIAEPVCDSGTEI